MKLEQSENYFYLTVSLTKPLLIKLFFSYKDVLIPTANEIKSFLT